MDSRGLVKSLDGGLFRAAGFVVNGPAVFRVD